MRLQYIGRPKTYRDPSTGNLVSDLDSIHRADALEGHDGDFGYDDFDEFGDDDSDDDDSDDDDSDDDEEDFGDDDDEVGATRGQRRRRSRRAGRRVRRAAKKAGRQSRRSGSKPPMQKTVVSGSATSAAAGTVSMTITPSHNFKAEDIAFNGSSANAAVTSITFGDNLVWNNPNGVDVTVFQATGFIRGMLKGAKVRAGVPIVITGTIAANDDTLKAALVGYKPGRVC